MFGIDYRIEIYVPADKRKHGYYVFPFLMDGEIVARLDLKADRQTGSLLVQAAHSESLARAGTAPRLAAELRSLASWLSLDRIIVRARGDLAPALSDAAAKV